MAITVLTKKQIPSVVVYSDVAGSPFAYIPQIPVSTPTLGAEIVSKSYLDTIVATLNNSISASSAGLDIKESVRVATTTNVGTYTATAGAKSRGQLTAAPNIVDGVSLVIGDRILVKNNSTAASNGIYVVTSVGTGATGIWDRSADFDDDAEVTSSAFTFVEEGSTLDNTGWVLSTNGPIIIGGASGTSLTFIQFSGTGVGVNTVSVATANGFAGTSSGGTNPSLTITTGITGIVYGNGTAISAATGAQIALGLGATYVSNATYATSAGSVTGQGTLATLSAAPAGTLTGTILNSTVVTSSLTSVGIITSGTWSGSFGAVSGANLTTLNAGNISTGTLLLARGGTSASLTAVNGGVVYSSATAMAITAAGVSGQMLKSNGAAAPTWQTLTLGDIPSSSYKQSVVVATTANIALSGLLTIDGYVLLANDRVLVKDQTLPEANGIYLAQVGAWTRASDADTTAEITSAITNVEKGTANGGKIFTNTFLSTSTLGTTAMPWYLVLTSFDTASINTVSKVVIRDASGNFSAGTITATLSGTATGLAGTNLGGEVTNSGNTITLVTTAVVGKLLTGYASTTGTVSATDSIVGAIGKLNGNIALKQTAISSTTYKVGVAVAGTVDGTNLIFTLANTPIATTESVFVNGVMQQRGAGNDYQISGATVTFEAGNAPQIGSIIIATYFV